MFKNNIDNKSKILVIMSYLIMIATNVAANLLPINNVTTAEVSDAYPNLFAPAGITFIIWGVIYTLLLFFVIYYSGFFNQRKSLINPMVMKRIAILFTITSLANAAWIFLWHYQILWLSIFVMLIILVSLIFINKIILEERLIFKERFLIRLPFSVYFGWITVATIANITAYLSKIGWSAFGLSEVFWTITILIVGMLIAAIVIIQNKDYGYGLTLIWAYAGIFIKHFSKEGFAAAYPKVLVTVSIAIIVFVLCLAYLLFNRDRRKRI